MRGQTAPRQWQRTTSQAASPTPMPTPLCKTTPTHGCVPNETNTNGGDAQRTCSRSLRDTETGFQAPLGLESREQDQGRGSRKYFNKNSDVLKPDARQDACFTRTASLRCQCKHQGVVWSAKPTTTFIIMIGKTGPKTGLVILG